MLNLKRAISASLSGLAVALTSLALTAMVVGLPSVAQEPQGLGEGAVVAKMRTASAAVKRFYAAHGVMPSSAPELDSVLRDIYPPEMFGTAMPIVSDGSYRVLSDVRIAVDPTIVNCNPDLWRADPPDRFNGVPAYNVVILTDGQKTYTIWAASISGNPILDSNNRAIIIYKTMEDNPSQ